MAQAGTILIPGAALSMQLEAHGIPVESLRGTGGVWTVTYQPGATPEEIAQGDAIVVAFDGLPMKYRTLADIYADISALTGAQLTSIWADLGGGTPAKYLRDVGPNAAAIMGLDWAVAESGATGASLLGARKRIMTMAVQDYPYYLDHPDFAPAVAVLGVESV